MSTCAGSKSAGDGGLRQLPDHLPQGAQRLQVGRAGVYILGVQVEHQWAGQSQAHLSH